METELLVRPVKIPNEGLKRVKLPEQILRGGAASAEGKEIYRKLERFSSNNQGKERQQTSNSPQKTPGPTGVGKYLKADLFLCELNGSFSM